MPTDDFLLVVHCNYVHVANWQRVGYEIQRLIVYEYRESSIRDMLRPILYITPSAQLLDTPSKFHNNDLFWTIVTS